MIDAPDHTTEKRGDRSALAWLLAALLGIALSAAAGMTSYGYTTAQAEQRFSDVVDYVATQSLSYDAFNSAYATKNLIRVMEIAGEAARDMERDGSADNATLEQYADQFNVTALIVTDASGNLVSESSTDNVSYESLAANLKEAPVLEVAAHPLKSYTARITLADDSVADIGCVARPDGEGIVVAVRHQSAKAVASNTLKLQSLLDGYETIDSGNIVIENDGKVVATNAVEPPCRACSICLRRMPSLSTALRSVAWLVRSDWLTTAVSGIWAHLVKRAIFTCTPMLPRSVTLRLLPLLLPVCWHSTAVL